MLLAFASQPLLKGLDIFQGGRSSYSRKGILPGPVSRKAGIQQLP